MLNTSSSNTLQLLYTITLDWTGTLYCGLTLAWNYKLRFVDISMPGYVSRALHKFLHTPATCAQHSPHAWIPPTYGATVQYAPDDDTSPSLDASALKNLQNVIGTFLYYARAVDSTMLVALGSLASAQTNGTAATTIAVTQLRNYCATHSHRRHPTTELLRHPFRRRHPTTELLRHPFRRRPPLPRQRHDPACPQ